jgi:protein ImuB
MTGTQERSLSLLPTGVRLALPRPVVSPLSSAQRAPPRLWLAVHLPRLPVESIAHAVGGPLAVVEGEGGQRWVYQANEPARRLGVVSGQRLNAALALVPGLKTRIRDRVREHLALEQIALWLGEFSPVVSLELPDAVLVEIRGSLRLFGGLEALKQRITTGLHRRLGGGQVGVAPTPQAALWLARAGVTDAVLETHQLPGRLARLPLSCLRWPTAVTAALRGMGIDCIGDYLRLPREGLARRFGQRSLDALDAALGHRSDPRPPFRAPERFRAQLELPSEIGTTAPLEVRIEGLLEDLEGFLSARQCGIQALQLTLLHEQDPPTQLRLGLMRVRRDARYLMELIREQLAPLCLPAPVVGLGLESATPRPLEAESATLRLGGDRSFRTVSSFAKGSAVPSDLADLLERLQARLGRKVLHSLHLVPDHRPECAWQPVTPGQGQKPVRVGPAQRPLWLLKEAQPLAWVAGKLWYGGMLRPLMGPERIESGWWDGRAVARDYYVAMNPQGVRLWIYQDHRSPANWFVHGVFG